MRRALIGVLLLLLIGAAAWFLTHRQQPPPSIVTAAVSRGPIVKVATLDPSLFRTAVEQAQANLAQAKADVDRLRATQSVADLTLGRDRTLAAHDMLPVADLESAETDSHTATADVAAALAKVTQAEADLKNAEVNLSKTIIASPQANERVVAVAAFSHGRDADPRGRPDSRRRAAGRLAFRRRRPRSDPREDGSR
ncbi:MAG TPA: hypothetical protein VH138_04365 [Vicinamibacterales bacterium]|nr:hypothetical protein [Vicinamibacterales bacterium]